MKCRSLQVITSRSPGIGPRIFRGVMEQPMSAFTVLLLLFGQFVAHVLHLSARPHELLSGQQVQFPWPDVQFGGDVQPVLVG